ncbi:hypothetical protein O6H91_23G020800 [Diphasiastrum complanatum]|uniref:Uncharacterized protein n=1 Tax=Diphasiastrum complanatum TaxID=34168 RepID=A0ACC2AA45_DIPCM|nr:hypothetical protein O6H91_Y171500 [Diphasiastrum complanatum]KAJ7513962.1 hypothetical protein O6H91_23G020800 [Diphasiastrum complanatum]
MSLVDYDPSSDEEEEEEHHPQPTAAAAASSISNSNFVIPRRTTDPEDLLSESGLRDAQISAPITLPDVSEILGWMNTDASPSTEAFRTSSAVVGRDSKKRQELNGSVHPSPHRKIPRGKLPPSRIPPDTAGGRLVPPQLQGRSNVATEDLGRLFVRRQTI